MGPLWIWIWNWFLAGSSRFWVGTATSWPSGISILGSVVVGTGGAVDAEVVDVWAVVAGVVGATVAGVVADVVVVATVAGGLATVGIAAIR